MIGSNQKVEILQNLIKRNKLPKVKSFSKCLYLVNWTHPNKMWTTENVVFGIDNFFSVDGVLIGTEDAANHS